MNALQARKVTVIVIALFLAAIVALLKGPVSLAPAQLFLESNRPILFLRLSRILLAAVAGAGLAVSGVVLQAILRNPLADPYLLGTSSGAGLGAVVAMLLGAGAAFLPYAAFIGALLSIVFVYALSRQHGKVAIQSLILSGVIISIALSALIVFLLTTATRETMHGVAWWLWGNLEVFDIRILSVVSAIVLAGSGVVYLFSQDLNAISIGEEEALHLGVNVELTKKLLLLATALITASLISVSGIIGFVGLVIPHMARMIIGPNHRLLIPVSCLLSASFMIACDVASRCLFAPQEIPIGVVTAVIGAPIFIILLKRSERVR